MLIAQVEIGEREAVVTSRPNTGSNIDIAKPPTFIERQARFQVF